jgi:hypothetical protein
MMWVNTIEVSRAEAGRAYVVASNYRNDDYGNYAWATDDFGQSWRSIAGGLPDGVITRSIREDSRNPDVLYMGTEFGLFYSADRGASWAELTGDLPTMAINDVVIHPRDNDLVLGTHSRGIWILDNVNALQELATIGDAAVHAFSTEPAEQIRYRSEGGHAGDAIFFGQNPARGGIIDYWLASEIVGEEGSGDAGSEGGETEAGESEAGGVSITVHDASGAEVARLDGTGQAGLNRVVWNLRHSEPRVAGRGGPGGGGPGGGPGGGGPGGGGFGFGGFQRPGPLVVPGTYTVLVSALDETSETTIEVREDPRIAARVSPEARAAWTAMLLEIGELRRDAQALSRRAQQALRAARGSGEADEEAAEGDDAPPDALEVLARELGELTSRIGRMEGEASSIVGPLTGDQTTQWAFFQEMYETLMGEAQAILGGESEPDPSPRVP